MEHITLILFFFFDSMIFGTFIFIPKSLRRVRTSFCEESIARGTACQCTGTPGQNTLLLPEPVDGEEALHKTRCDHFFWCQSQPEQVTLTSSADTISPPHQWVILVLLNFLTNHPPLLPRPPVIIASTSSPVTVNFNAQLQRAEYHDPCHMESQKSYVSLHSGNATHLCYQLLVIENAKDLFLAKQNCTCKASEEIPQHLLTIYTDLKRKLSVLS